MSERRMGFTYRFREYGPAGNLVSDETIHNLVPIEGLDYINDASLRNASSYPALYVGLYEGDYTPTPADKMETFPAAAVELTAYSSATRPALTLGASAGGQCASAAPITFTGTTNGKQARGGFVAVSPTKGATTGPLLSAVRFPSPKSLDQGGKLEVDVFFAAASI